MVFSAPSSSHIPPPISRDRLDPLAARIPSGSTSVMAATGPSTASSISIPWPGLIVVIAGTFVPLRFVFHQFGARSGGLLLNGGPAEYPWRRTLRTTFPSSRCRGLRRSSRSSSLSRGDRAVRYCADRPGRRASMWSRTQLAVFFAFRCGSSSAAAYSMPLLLITLLMFWWQRRVSAGASIPTTVSVQSATPLITILLFLFLGVMLRLRAVRLRARRVPACWC